jgi:uncharacterized protein YndB with AHSA1/START domain
MNKELSMSKSAKINAGTDEVWDALTNPDKIKEYLLGAETVTDWKVGHPVVFKGEYQGKSYEDKGTILQNKEPSVLQYNYWTGLSGLEDKPENYSVVTFELDQLGDDKTLLSWTKEGFSTVEEQLACGPALEESLVKIKELVENH